MMVSNRRFSNTRIAPALNSTPTSSPTSATPLSNTKPVSPSLFKCIFLHEWWLVKPQGQRDGLAVGGVASIERERVFLSTVIAKRHEANVLETEDGIAITFRGFINTSRTCENGFPSELCRHFLFGFPHDWKKYTVYSFGDEYIDEVTGFGYSNACSQKRADDAFPFSLHDNDLTMTHDFFFPNHGVLNYCPAPKVIWTGLGHFLRNVSKQSMKTMECEYMDYTTSLKSSQPQVDRMHNAENGILDVTVESLAGNPESCQSLMAMRKSTVKSPISTKKTRKCQLLSDCKEKQLIKQKSSTGAVNTSSGMVRKKHFQEKSRSAERKREIYSGLC